MAIAATPEQVVSITHTGASTVGTTTIVSAPAGSRLYLGLTSNNSAQTLTPTSPNTTWTRLSVDTSMSLRFEVWEGVVAGGATGTTLTITGAVNFSTYACKGYMVEWRGATTSAALVTTNTGVTSATVTTESITPVAGQPGVALAFGRKYASNTLLSGPTNSFTDPSASPVSDGASRFAYKYAASLSGSYQTAWTFPESGLCLSTILVLYESAVATLEFNTQPANGWVGEALKPIVVHAKTGGVLNTGFTGNVTLSKASGSGTAAGTLTVAAVAGVATFSAARIDSLGGPHTLQAAASAHANAVSTSFKIASGSGTGGAIGGDMINQDQRQLGATGQVIPIDMRNADGSPAEGLTHNDVTIYRSVDGASPVSVGTLVTVPDRAVYTSLGFVEIDTAQNRGQYYFGLPTLPSSGKKVRYFAKSNIGANTGAEGRLDVFLLADNIFAAAATPGQIGEAVRDTAIAGAAASSMGATLATVNGNAATAASYGSTLTGIQSQTAKLTFDGSNNIRSTVESMAGGIVTSIRDAVLNWSPGSGYNLARLFKDQLLMFAGALTGRTTPAAVPSSEVRTLGGKTLTVTYNPTTSNYSVASDTTTDL